MQSYIFSKVLEETKFYSRSKEEVLLLRQDRSAAGAFFPFFSGVWHLNKDDPDAPNYSRLDELQDYVGSDGAYHFRQAQHIFFVAIYYPIFKSTSRHIKKLEENIFLKLYRLCYPKLTVMGADNCLIFQQNSDPRFPSPSFSKLLHEFNK